eukprot:Lithocolla_globosa_v1_NODE_2818_length_1858_cov_31.494731.p2 type:complete len:188 gc:universal NODE_2818_length_1858_cov_31.494731:1232-1795(+)
MTQTNNTTKTTETWTKKPEASLNHNQPNQLIVKGLPTTFSDGIETQDSILSTLTKLFKIGMFKQFPSSAIQDAYRLSKSKDAVLKFKNDQLDRKTDLQQSTKVLWQENNIHLTTSLLDDDEENDKNIYIYLRLSTEMSRLHFMARQIPKEKLKYKWICARTHKIYVKKTDDDHPIEIISKDQLQQFQ